VCVLGSQQVLEVGGYKGLPSCQVADQTVAFQVEISPALLCSFAGVSRISPLASSLSLFCRLFDLFRMIRVL
jgi:hypothetical protein